MNHASNLPTEIGIDCHWLVVIFFLRCNDLFYLFPLKTNNYFIDDDDDDDDTGE